jgi:FKBP-type peptidyl-prolyl cis-trans isomerase
MMRTILAAAALAALAACGGNGGVMDEIKNAEKADAEAAQEAANAMSRAVQEDAQRFPSGLELQFVRRGNDQSLAMPTMNATVLVHYEGSS